ncbi:hypothetical protein SMD22_00250 (plasmid) [Brevibacillus halotolerans]|nr:hypothetical protein SMD22_00250 [Brevibacillus halotolerans]
MNRNDAREHFENSGLSYSKIKEEEIKKLVDILSEELSSYLEYGGDHAQEMGMRVRKPRVKDIKCLKKGLVYAYIKIDGSYFERREGISFNKDGFIGFGGEFSDVNVEPILKAFCRWCDTIANKQTIER